MTLRFLLISVLLLLTSTAALASDSVRLSLPKGFCLLDPQKSEKEAELQRNNKQIHKRVSGVETLAYLYECTFLEDLRSKGSGTLRSQISVARMWETEDRIRDFVDDPGFRKSYFEVPIERFGRLSTEKYQNFNKEFESSEEFDEKRNLGVYSIDKNNMSFSYMEISGQKAGGKFELRTQLISSVLIDDRLYWIGSTILLHTGADLSHFWDIHDDFVKSFIRSNS